MRTKIRDSSEATPKQIAELENIFEENRDNTKIRQMYHSVEQYEETIKQQVVIEEQARLKEQEAEQLDSKAKQIKQK